MKYLFYHLVCGFLLTKFISFEMHANAQVVEPSSEGVADRLILELDRAVFSQRNLESYIVVKHSVFTNGSHREISADNWQKVRSEFLNDMIIDRETNRLGSFRVNPQIMQRAVESLNKLRSLDQKLDSTLGRLQLSHQQIQQQIGTALRIEAYKRGKFPDRNSDLSVLNYVEDDLLVSQPWFNKLRRSLMFRWFQGTDKYSSVSFNE